MKKKIFVVDDEPDVASTVEFNLKESDGEYEVTCVNSGKKCLELLEKNQIPDLILLDIMMPEMNGWEVFNKIKENQAWAKIPIIFLTARIDRIAENAGSFLGDDYIEKPYDPTDLKKRVDNVLRKNGK
ncbi:MAG: response regulator [Euryarchaeota archaeon]|nr:response regulator [Euryarchaeota archaeon]